jgi:coproporphyrinogen III oxidase-like Fe-S oxidoreductase
MLGRNSTQDLLSIRIQNYQISHSKAAELVDPQLEGMLTHFVSLGLVERAGDVLSITDQGRPYARNVAAAFDRHAAGQKIPFPVGKLS